jgi:hypothetical protein
METKPAEIGEIVRSATDCNRRGRLRFRRVTR